MAAKTLPFPPSSAARTREGFVKPTTSCRKFSGRFPGLIKISHQVNWRSNQQPHPKSLKSMVRVRARRSEHDSQSTELQAVQLSLKLSVQPERGSTGEPTPGMQSANDRIQVLQRCQHWKNQSRMYIQSGSMSFAKYQDQNVYKGVCVWLNNSARGIRNTFLLIKTWCACPLPASDSPRRGLSAGTCGHSGPHRLDPLMTSTELRQGTWELRYTGQHTHTHRSPSIE